MTCVRTDGLLLQDHPGQKTQRPKEIFGAAFFRIQASGGKKGLFKNRIGKMYNRYSDL